jgi:2,4-didehydro-3-deoxy-L-rhamnonate hydrolase
MRLCRFNDNRLGVVVEDHVFNVSDILDTLRQYRYPLPRFDPFIAQLDELTPHILAQARNAKALPLSNIQILSPVACPGKIIAAPVNYQKHLIEARADPGIHHASQIAEIQKVGLFLKATEFPHWTQSWRRPKASRAAKRSRNRTRCCHRKES